MPEPYQFQSALATLGIEARALAAAAAADAGVVLSERAARAQLAIRGDAGNEAFCGGVAEVLGVEPPAEANTARSADNGTLLWLGPDEWLAVMAKGAAGDWLTRLGDSLKGAHHALADVSHSRAVIGLEGARSREVLMKGTNIDLHPSRFRAGSCIQARLGRCHMLLHQLDDAPAYDVYVHRSFAVYAWSWLSDAAGEYALAVRGAAGG